MPCQCWMCWYSNRQPSGVWVVNFQCLGHIHLKACAKHVLQGQKEACPMSLPLQSFCSTQAIIWICPKQVKISPLCVKYRTGALRPVVQLKWWRIGSYFHPTFWHPLPISVAKQRVRGLRCCKLSSRMGHSPFWAFSGLCTWAKAISASEMVMLGNVCTLEPFLWYSALEYLVCKCSWINEILLDVLQIDSMA